MRVHYFGFAYGRTIRGSKRNADRSTSQDSFSLSARSGGVKTRPCQARGTCELAHPSRLIHSKALEQLGRERGNKSCGEKDARKTRVGGQRCAQLRDYENKKKPPRRDYFREKNDAGQKSTGDQTETEATREEDRRGTTGERNDQRVSVFRSPSEVRARPTWRFHGIETRAGRCVAAP